MYISFTPQRRDATLAVSKAGDVLIINNESYDFSSIPEGGTLPDGEVPCDWITGPVERIDGDIHITLLLPHGPNPSEAVAFPTPISVTSDGIIQIPEDTHVDA